MAEPLKPPRPPASEDGATVSSGHTAGRAPLEGLPNRVALWRLLTHHGIQTSLHALNEEGGPSLDLGRMIQMLRANGLEARCVQARLNDLAHLQLPTLVLNQADEWLLLRKRQSRGWWVEHAGGAGLIAEADLETAFSGTALEITRAFPDKGGLWIRLLKLLPEHRTPILMSLGATGLAQGLALVTPWLTAKLVDGALSSGAESMLLLLCTGMLLAALFRTWVGWIREITLNAFAMRIDIALERGLFDHLLHLPFKHLQGKTLGELLQAFSGIKRARTLVLNRGLAAVFDACTVIALLVYMLALVPALAGVVVLGSLALSLASAVIGYRQMRVTRLQIEASQEEHSALAELIHGASTLKATGSQGWVLDRWKEKLADELAHGLRQERIGLWGNAIGEILTQGSNICVLIWGGFKVLDGGLSLGQFLAFSQLSGSFVGAVSSLSQTILSFALAKPQMAEVHEAFATPSQPRTFQEGPRNLPGPVLVEDAWFRYEEKGPWIIQGFNLQVQPGTFHHIKGASGSGKSTLLKLLAGLYSPDSGRISLGGLDCGSATQMMIFLPQFPNLSSGSVLENLRIFSGDMPKTHLIEVAKETGLDAWVNTLPMGYQTMIASGGGNFSGGQRQLVAITGVLASDKQLLLLDEALSNLDWVSRQRIIQSPRFQGRTVIYASHEEVLAGDRTAADHLNHSQPKPPASDQASIQEHEHGMMMPGGSS